MTDFYLCKILFQGNQNSMTEDQIQELDSAQRRREVFQETTHFNYFLIEKSFDFSLENWPEF